MWLVGTPQGGRVLDNMPAHWKDLDKWPCVKVAQSADCLSLRAEPEPGYKILLPKVRVDATPLINGNRRFLTLTQGGVLKLYDDKGHKIEFPEGARGITAAAFSSDGSRLAVCAGSLPTIYDTWTLKSQLILERHSDDVISAAFHPHNAAWLVTTSADGIVKVWNLGAKSVGNTGKQLLATLQGHQGAVTSGSFDPSKLSLEDLSVVSSGVDGTVRIWSIEEPNFSLTFEVEGDNGLTVGEVRSAAFDAAGERILTAGQRGGARVWDVPKLPKIEPNNLKKVFDVCLPWIADPNTMILKSRDRDMQNCMTKAHNAGFLAR
jgi:WD40 repeat protein